MAVTVEPWGGTPGSADFGPAAAAGGAPEKSGRGT